jgi:hypothetical protein
MTGCRYLKSKLQFLSKLFCNRDIQTLVGKGHDPNEDAMSSMELVLMKLRKGFKYGDACLSSGGYWEGPSKEKILSVISNSIVSFIFYALLNRFNCCFICVSCSSNANASHLVT